MGLQEDSVGPEVWKVGKEESKSAQQAEETACIEVESWSAQKVEVLKGGRAYTWGKNSS